MSIRYIASGDEFRAKQILGEGRHQLSILKNLMSFQDLKQLQRTVRFNDGTLIKVSSCFDQDTVNIFVPPVMPVIEEIEIPVGEELFFELKIIRDDGTIIDDTLIEEIEIYDDDPDVTSYGSPQNPPILYIYNMREYYENLTPEEIELVEDQFYNLNSDGTRKKERYNSDTEYWTFDGYQRPLSWMWGDTETDDLTKPTSPPSSLRYAKKWNGEEYIAQETKGYYVRVRYKDGPRSVFRVLTKEQKEAGQLNRGYGYADDDLVYQPEAVVYMVENNLIKPDRYIFPVPYIKGEVTTSWPEDGYYYYRFKCYEEDPPDCEDVDDINYSKPYFFVPCLQGNYYYSMDTDFWKRYKIISSVPYNVHGQIEVGLNLGCISSPPYNYGSIWCHGLDNISTTISGAGVSLDYTTGDVNDKVEADTAYPRTFTPVDVSKAFSPLPDSSLNEQEYEINMSITGGLHRIGWGREFSNCFSIAAARKDENG